ncbi:MAG: hypothetical protein AMXMBFR77_25310 [Phycisphaerales bacterium]|nr:MAG: hypothetical protein BroJett004_21330 [Planctomycetota bacterium]
MDGVAGDDLRGLSARAGAEGLNADGFKKARQTVHPRFVLPTGVGQEKVQATAGAGLRAGAGVSGMEARIDHRGA